MDLQEEAVKIRKALEDVEMLLSTASGTQAYELAQLQTFFLKALDQVPVELIALCDLLDQE